MIVVLIVLLILFVIGYTVCSTDDFGSTHCDTVDNTYTQDPAINAPWIGDIRNAGYCNKCLIKRECYSDLSYNIPRYCKEKFDKSSDNKVIK